MLNKPAAQDIFKRTPAIRFNAKLKMQSLSIRFGRDMDIRSFYDTHFITRSDMGPTLL